MQFASSKRRRPGQSGVTSLELAATFGLFIVMTLAVLDLSLYFASQQALSTLVTAAARLGYIGTINPATLGNGTGCDVASGQGLISTYAPLLDQGQLTQFCVSVQQDATLPNGVSPATGIQVLTVTATYNYNSFTPGLEALIGPMTATMTYQF